jgi:hypothetical protein
LYRLKKLAIELSESLLPKKESPCPYDAEMFKQSLKKRDKKIRKTRSFDGPGS